MPDAAPAERFAALGRALRSWARAEPATYALLYGAPVPGYQAPAERTTGPGTRVVRLLLDVAAQAHAAGTLVVPDEPAPAPPLAAGLEGIRTQFGIALPDAVLTRGVLVWAALFGCVDFEVFGQYGPDGLGDPDALFERHLAVLAAEPGGVSQPAKRSRSRITAA
ncbi:TetR-like C-terminal domain-containing protein [Nocardioides convexus]|uniref:TetR-like C-terminal domain-containing protein n=1 Tax=Nocardioides convexus TaxID=2712224 RepID=UPI0024183937|nr:TetR-like C-terminal domain-containing protein [Nocardioides convexus]